MVTTSAPSTPPQRASRRKQSLSPNRPSLSTPLFSPPQISVEDVSRPLTEPEDPLHTQPNPPSHNDSNKHAGERKQSLIPKRKRIQSVGWKKKWDDNHFPWHSGRVLIVDCYSRDHSDDGRRKTQAYEFCTISELEEFYSKGPGKTSEHALRVIHVQNAVWAREFLLEKFSIASSGVQDDIVGTGFQRWAKYDRPQYRAGKPVLNSKTFRSSKDPWRGVSRTGFGVDYFKSYKPGVISNDTEAARGRFKFMELNHWEEEMGAAVHGYDVYVQRLSVYIQRNEGPVTLSPSDNADVRNPYMHRVTDLEHTNGGLDPPKRASSLPILDKASMQRQVLERLSALDNSSTIIVFEASQTGKPNDTLIQARSEIETRWRRIMFYLNRDDYITDDRLALDCMDLVLKDIFKGLQASWEKTLSKCEEHVNILEDKIYENPADESRAPELWTNSSLWLKIEKLMSLQKAAIGDLQVQMRELAESPNDDDDGKMEWFKNTPRDIGRIAGLIDEELIKPTANLSDLMYKSVGIRDSRHSLELGTSMWRLSWITFVFLPLTFAVGFFGMNVDTFQVEEGYPSIKWYFIAAVPLMVVVIVLYLFIKSVVSNRRDNPLQRGVYEQIYDQFAEERPELWSRTGPRSHIMPKGRWSKIKWYIVKSWFHPSKTITKRNYSEIDKMGVWARIQRQLAEKWLKTIDIVPGSGDLESGLLPEMEFSTVTELMPFTTSVAMADGSPAIATRMGTPPFRQYSSSRRRSSSGGRVRPERPLSPGSDMVVEESDDGDGESSNGKEKEKGRDSANVPVEESLPSFGLGITVRRSISETLPPSHTTGGMLNVPMSVRRGDEHAP
ncbi:hypothetical protein BLS_002032 [Venturia inaequalis]|uniref:Uncharacterized protein n=1 Tax=Venturia inaequalis TaxID=5025 RepID=A0A8H3UGD1_VENIN|nr:hypothetical protein BLS_002032 [Venturia inaequalis]KAE9969689.1 hypothetical protein EG327_010543 [Venturia inaequalis]RDI81485.1 hypothetical protein Vi05172_g8525 [Venturia inaequalis]